MSTNFVIPKKKDEVQYDFVHDDKTPKLFTCNVCGKYMGWRHERFCLKA